jgi:DNA-binding PadR family transcriptional regulator
LSKKKVTAQKRKQVRIDSMSRPQGAPRGLLMFYMLHHIAKKPTHGYEILQDITNKTDGTWRPGAGSIYPVLKKLEDHGYIETDDCAKGETSQCVYRITPKGSAFLHKTKDFFKDAGRRWSSMRRIFIEFIEPENVSNFLINGTQMYFTINQEIVKSMESTLSYNDLQYVLREYALILERQLNWSMSNLEEVKKKSECKLNDNSLAKK